jgi:hypothetical protein
MAPDDHGDGGGLGWVGGEVSPHPLLYTTGPWRRGHACNEGNDRTLRLRRLRLLMLGCIPACRARLRKQNWQFWPAGVGRCHGENIASISRGALRRRTSAPQDGRAANVSSRQLRTCRWIRIGAKCVRCCGRPPPANCDARHRSIPQTMEISHTMRLTLSPWLLHSLRHGRPGGS